MLGIAQCQLESVLAGRQLDTCLGLTRLKAGLYLNLSPRPLNQRKRLFSEEAAKASSETLLREIGSAGLTELVSRSDGGAKTKDGTKPGDITSPPGDSRATNLPPSQTSTSCFSLSCLAAS